MSCGGGSQRRSRVQIEPRFGGVACPHYTETRPCNTHACPRNCVTRGWGAYTTCTKSCGGGSQRRSRVQIEPRFGDRACPHYTETRACNTHACPRNCVTRGWQSWTTCTKSCAGGSQRRSRVQIEPRFGGKACPHYTETRACNTHVCPIDCGVATWGSWDKCTKPCGIGRQTRTRTHVQPKFGGKSCPATQDVQNCNVQNCPKLCTHTKCKYLFRGGEWRTVVMHDACKERNGNDYHCEHHFGTRTVTLLGGRTEVHSNTCTCHCDFEGTSSITHRHVYGGQGSNLLNPAHRNLQPRSAMLVACTSSAKSFVRVALRPSYSCGCTEPSGRVLKSELLFCFGGCMTCCFD